VRCDFARERVALALCGIARYARNVMEFDTLATPAKHGDAVVRPRGMNVNALARRTFDDGLYTGSSELAVGAHDSGVLPQNPAETLAMLMDFSGSVALAKLLHAPAPEGESHPEAGPRARKLLDKVRGQLDALLPRALRPLNGPRAPRTPQPPELLEVLTRITGSEGRVPEGEQVSRLARELAAPLLAAVGASLRQTQAHLTGVRWEITTELQALGPRAERLERIDAALQRSIQVKLGELFERMELAAELTFERACAEACAALPEAFGADELADWAADSGWIARYRARCEYVARAWFGQMRRSLEGLLLAAAEAEVGS
jgi:hypothetical protein